MRLKRSALVRACVTGLIMFGGVASAGPGNLWSNAGGDLQNTRSQPSEHKISVDTVGGLSPK
jgi:hypothetical protein